MLSGQATRSGAQPICVQNPPSQTPLAHTVPQSPQWNGSSRNDVQIPVPSQSHEPAGHPTWVQLPPSQTPLSQTTPHPPQLNGSAERSTQSRLPVQSVQPAAQPVATHAPPMHAAGPPALGQLTSQEPQRKESESRS